MHYLDSEIQDQINAFKQHMLESEYVYRRAISLMAARQMMLPLKPISKVSQRRQLLWALCHTLARGVQKLASIAFPESTEEPEVWLSSDSATEPVVIDVIAMDADPDLLHHRRDSGLPRDRLLTSHSIQQKENNDG